MAGVQRFVTYMYYYNKNQKYNNVGFAKVYVRGEVGQIQIHIRGDLYGRKSYPVYLFWREEEKCETVLIGEIQVKGAELEANLPYESEQISGKNITMNQIKGIYIPVDEEKWYASVWDEEPFDITRIRLFTDSMQNVSQQGSQDISESIQENDKIYEEEEIQEDTGEQPEEKEAKEPETPADLSAQELESSGAESFLAGYHRILQENPQHTIIHMGEKQIRGSRIQLKDLRRLPREYWKIGNNSFLVHGFFSHQHLFIGSYQEGEQEVVLLGVPGEYAQPEQMVAAMFGFTEFVAAETEENHQGILQAAQVEMGGKRGYWCHFFEF